MRASVSPILLSAAAGGRGRLISLACAGVEVADYLLMCRGTPPTVAAVALGEGARPGWDPIAPATDLTRSSGADVDLVGGYLYYCDVHRCALAAPPPLAFDATLNSEASLAPSRRRYEMVRQRLDGTGREVFMDRDLDNCHSLAVDWMGTRRRRPIRVHGVGTVGRGS